MEPIIINWLSYEGLIFVQTLNDEEEKSAKQARYFLRY